VNLLINSFSWFGHRVDWFLRLLQHNINTPIPFKFTSVFQKTPYTIKNVFAKVHRMINKAQRKILLVIVLLLCIPAIEMLDGTNEINWTLLDFFAAFVLLTTLGFLIERVIRKTKSRRSKVIVIVLLVLSFALLWAELAVGIFDSPIAGD
jgi:dipeptide/tripeptide permease